MKKIFLAASVAAISFSLLSCVALMPGAEGQPAAQPAPAQSPSNPQQDALGGILNGVVGAASEEYGLGGVLGNIISSVVGSVTTTQANLVGSWTYYEPCVQFESENLLTQAGGAASAANVEAKIASLYKMVGITEGRLVFTFAKDGQMTYTIGSRTMNGTYVFDAKQKTVTITTAAGYNFLAYVTISGNQMSLCFDTTKLLNLLSSFGGTQTTLGTLGTLAQSFSGMKTGFKFKR